MVNSLFSSIVQKRVKSKGLLIGLFYLGGAVGRSIAPLITATFFVVSNLVMANTDQDSDQPQQNMLRLFSQSRSE